MTTSKRTFFAVFLLFLAIPCFAQMDMLPEIFRDLPPEISSGLPSDMTFEDYRQITRNVDFFTMFMSMWVPGYGFYQVERPGRAAAVMAGRVAATGLMGIAIARQWDDLRDVVHLQSLSEAQFNRFMVNAGLFGGGIFLNGMGWVVDVLGAYHIAKAEKDKALYRYGLVAETVGSPEVRLRSYLERTVVQSDDRLNLETELERYLTTYPDGAAAAKMANHRGALSEQAGEHMEAFTYIGRSLFGYDRHALTKAAQQTMVRIVHNHRDDWTADWDRLWDMASSETSQTTAPEDRFYHYLEDLHDLESEEFLPLYAQEIKYFLWRYPGSTYEAELLYALGRRSIEIEDPATAAASHAALIYFHPKSAYYYQSILALGGLYEETLEEPTRAVRIYRFAKESVEPTSQAEQEAEAQSLRRLNQLLDEREQDIPDSHK